MNQKELYKLITQAYTDPEDFRTLILNLTFDPALQDLSYANLGGDSTPIQGKARELILRIRQRQEPYQTEAFSALVEAIAEQKPFLDLTKVGGPPPSTGSSESSMTTAAPSRSAATAAPPPPAEEEMKYVDFDIRIRRNFGKGYPVEAYYNVDGRAGTPEIFQQFDLQEPEFQDLYTYLKELVAEKQDVKEFGKRLRQLLFPPRVWTLFSVLRSNMRSQGKGVRVRLQIDPPELSGLAWEYCYDDEKGSFFAQDLETPMVRYIQQLDKADDLETASPLKVLLVLSGPEDLPELSLQEEERRIRTALDALGDLVVLEVLKGTDASAEKLQQTLASFKPHVLHFVGHGEFRQRGADEEKEGAIILVDENMKKVSFTSEQLSNIMRRRGVKLVVLNACETAMHDDTSEGKPFMGVAPALVRADIPAVIAMQFAVPDKIALKYSQSLYSYLVMGKPLDTAVTEMRLSVASGATVEEQVLWGIPVLFMRAPDGVILRPPSPAAVRTAAAAAPTPSAQPHSEPAPAQPSSSSTSSGGGFTINIGGNANIGGNITGGDSVGGDRIDAGGDVSIVKGDSITHVAGSGEPVKEPSLTDLLTEIEQSVSPIKSVLDEEEALDLEENLEEAQEMAAKPAPKGSRIARRLGNVLDIVEESDANDSRQVIKQLEKAIKMAKKL